jgi:ribosomal protein S18 acetylase RimI-like enzyme
MIRIIDVQTAAELTQVRGLFRAYFQFLAQEDDLKISDQAIEDELATLPGEFAPPEGRLIMAVTSEQALGCAALRRIDEQVCELKRMFVLPQFRGQGIGKALARKLIEDARTMGYECMRLDTGNFWTAAIKLYESLGFQRIEPDHNVPEDLRKVSIFMELRLN